MGVKETTAVTASEEPVEGIVVGGKRGTAEKRRRSIGRRAVLGGIVVVLVCAVAVLAVVTHDDTSRPKQPTKAKTATAVVTDTAPDVSSIPPDERLQSLAVVTDYAGQQQILGDQAKKTTDPTQLSDIYLQQASLALRASKYTDAVSYANQSKQVQPSSSLPYAMLAKIAGAQGSTVTAHSNWQAAIDRLDKSSKQYGQLLKQYKAGLEETS